MLSAMNSQTIQQSWFNSRPPINQANSDLKEEEKRIQSFSGHWPSNAPLTPQQLAAAGLYYTGPGDRVQCAWCNGGLYNWEAEDIPISEHKKHFPKCLFIQRKLDEMIGRGHNNCDGNSDQKKKDDTNTWENTPAVKIVGQMGYDAEIIAKGVRKVLNDWCKDLTASKLLDAIYEIEEVPFDDSKEEQLPHANHTDNNVDRLCEVMQNDVHIGQLSNKNQESLIQNGISTSESGASNRSTVYSTSVLNHREQYVERNNPENPVPNKNKSSESKSDNFTLTKLKPVADNYEPTSKGSANNEIVTLLEENKKLKQSKSCKICLENEVNILFLPCRHLACCESCADSVKLCPLCRHAIVATVKTYLG